MLLSLKGFAAEVEREKIIERTRRGLKARTDAGKLKPGSRALFGYRYPVEMVERDGEMVPMTIRDRYEIDPQTAPIVRRFFHWYAEGTPLLGIATRLNAEGVSSPTGVSPWTRAVLQRMLRNPSYKGEAFANRYGASKERGRTKMVARPREEWVRLPDGVIPPLIDAATFDAAQERASRNAVEAARKNSNPEAYLLRGGYVMCGHCGRAAFAGIRTGRDKTRTPVYRVVANAEQHTNCPAVSIIAATLDAAVEVYLKRVVLDRQVLALMIERLRDDDTATTDAAATEATLSGVKKRQAIVANAVATLDDPDAAEPLLAKLGSLAKERRVLEAELAQLRTRADAATATLARLDSLQEQAETIAARWSSLPYAAKRDLIAAIDLRVTLYEATAPDRYLIESDVDSLLDAIASQSRTSSSTISTTAAKFPSPSATTACPRSISSPAQAPRV